MSAIPARQALDPSPGYTWVFNRPGPPDTTLRTSQGLDIPNIMKLAQLNLFQEAGYILDPINGQGVFGINPPTLPTGPSPADPDSTAAVVNKGKRLHRPLLRQKTVEFPKEQINRERAIH